MGNNIQSVQTKLTTEARNNAILRRELEDIRGNLFQPPEKIQDVAQLEEEKEEYKQSAPLNIQIDNRPIESVQNDAGMRHNEVEDFEEQKGQPFVDELDNI